MTSVRNFVLIVATCLSINALAAEKPAQAENSAPQKETVAQHAARKGHKIGTTFRRARWMNVAATEKKPAKMGERKVVVVTAPKTKQKGALRAVKFSKAQAAAFRAQLPNSAKMKQVQAKKITPKAGRVKGASQ